ncbi:hypothetical protein MRX96_040385 [Rhipicephalus microplus]
MTHHVVSVASVVDAQQVVVSDPTQQSTMSMASVAVSSSEYDPALWNRLTATFAHRREWTELVPAGLVVPARSISGHLKLNILRCSFRQPRWLPSFHVPKLTRFIIPRFRVNSVIILSSPSAAGNTLGTPEKVYRLQNSRDSFFRSIIGKTVIISF